MRLPSTTSACPDLPGGVPDRCSRGLPVLLLMIGQLSGVIYFSVGLVAVLGLGLWAVDLVLLWLGGRTFQRGDILARL